MPFSHMDVFAQEFEDWLVERGAEEQAASAILYDDDEHSVPSLEQSSCTDSESFSSLDDDNSIALSSEALTDDEEEVIENSEKETDTRRRGNSKILRRCRARHSVSFHETVHVREHAVTIGDHPSCNDSCPITLDWYHSEEILTLSLDDSSKTREGKYEMPKRLTFNERRKRLVQASAFGSERIQNQELERVIDMLHQSWSEPKILPPPVLEEEIKDDDEEEKETAEDSDEDRLPVLKWRRVSFRRQQSFNM